MRITLHFTEVHLNQPVLIRKLEQPHAVHPPANHSTGLSRARTRLCNQEGGHCTSQETSTKPSAGTKNSLICINHSNICINCSCQYLGCNVLSDLWQCSADPHVHLGGKVYCIMYKAVSFSSLLAFEFLVILRIYNQRFEEWIYT